MSKIVGLDAVTVTVIGPLATLPVKLNVSPTAAGELVQVAVNGDAGSVCDCAKPAHRRSADAAREILLAEILSMN
jgi:hypothetical protein